MRKLLLVTALALVTTTAAAQDMMFSFFAPSRTLPQTVKLDDGHGNIIGTGTVSTFPTERPTEIRIVIRDLKGVLVGTIVIADGKQTFYDPNGRTKAAPPLQLPPETAPDHRGVLDHVKPDAPAKDQP